VSVALRSGCTGFAFSEGAAERAHRAHRERENAPCPTSGTVESLDARDAALAYREILAERREHFTTTPKEP